MQSYFVECKIIRTISFGARWRRLVSFKPRPLLQQERNFHYPLDRRLDGTPKQFGHCRNKNSLCSCWESNPDIPVRKFVIQKTIDRNIDVWTRIQTCDIQYWHLAKRLMPYFLPRQFSCWESNPDIPVRKFVIHKTLDRNIDIWTRIQTCDVQYWNLVKR
jgi:hypothetical protein